MKKLLLGTVLLSGLTLFALGTSASAAESKSVDTTTDVKFEKGDTPGPVDPGGKEPGPIGPKFPPIEVGGINLVKAPQFDFGQVKISPLGAEYPVNQVEITHGEEANPTTAYVAPFLQVADVSGGGKMWTVSVGQKGALSAGTKETLANTRVRLYGQTINNTNGESVEASLQSFAKVAKQNFAEIPVDGTSLDVFKLTKAGETNGSYSSLIFEDNYTDAKSATKEKSSGVMLSVPKGDTPKVGANYTAKLVWTLAVTP